MSPDWNIVDDEPAETPPPTEADEARLNLNRVRLVTLERRAAERQRQWAIGVAVLAMLAAIALLGRAIAWHDARPRLASAILMLAVLAAAVGIRIASKFARRHRTPSS